MNRPKQELVKLTLMAIFSLCSGLLPGVDNFAHIGGFLSGFVVGMVFMPSTAFSQRDRKIKIGVVFGGLVASIIGYTVMFQFYYSGNARCNVCKYLNCFPPMTWCEQKCKSRHRFLKTLMSNP
jgi:hypothetical protein